MTIPNSVLEIMNRVATLRQPPPALVDIKNRFGMQLSSATSQSSSGLGQAATVVAGAPLGTASVSATATRMDLNGATLDTTLSSLPPATGTWAERIPNDRGKRLAPAIQAAAKKYNLDPAFLAAVFFTESSYTPNAVSPTGAIGLGQLMPETADWLGVNPWDPLQNMDGAAKLYRYYLDKTGGNLEMAIANYAAGPGAVKAAGGIPDEFTRNYVTKLIGRTEYLNGQRSTMP